jgi:hypothetical protein
LVAVPNLAGHTNLLPQSLQEPAERQETSSKRGVQLDNKSLASRRGLTLWRGVVAGGIERVRTIFPPSGVRVCAQSVRQKLWEGTTGRLCAAVRRRHRMCARLQLLSASWCCSLGARPPPAYAPFGLDTPLTWPLLCPSPV